VKLLFDQNLSPQLVSLLSDLFPGSSHVQSLGLDRGKDIEIWSHALTHEFIIVTKDEDFSDLGVVNGFPPKIIWLQLGNCTTGQIEHVLRSRFREIEDFGADSTVGTLVLA
jgi:predicted nuclease of predicted toxin-antitoxin system